MTTNKVLNALNLNLESTTSKFILAKLATIADDDGFVFVGIRRGAEICNVTTPTFKTHIESLEKAGFVAIEKGTDFRPSTFQLLI